MVHNETSTGCVTHPLEVRKIIDAVKHPALLMVDTISGLGSLEYEHDAWGIDVSVAGSQKGLMRRRPRFQPGPERRSRGEGEPGHALVLGLANHRDQRPAPAVYSATNCCRIARGGQDPRG